MSQLSSSETSLWNVDSSGAVVCRRGHVANAYVERPRPVGGRCDECGSKLLVACEVCGYRIKGATRATLLAYEAPSFCDGCGTIHPWVGRRPRLQYLQNVVAESNIDPASALEIDELLGDLLAGEGGAPEDTWVRILRLAPELWHHERARPALAALVPAAVKTRLGLAA